LAHLERYDEALLSYNTALSLSAGHASVLHNRGLLLRRMGRYEDALADMHACIVKDPDDPVVWCNLGRIQENLRQFDKALEGYIILALTLSPLVKGT
jgi:tetratricopeptide (TPR) repeat protein